MHAFNRHLLGWIALAAIAACLAAFASPPSAHAAEKGLNVDLTWGTTEEEQDRTIEAIRDTRADWVRIEIDWHWLESAWATWNGWEHDRIQAHMDRAIDLSHEAGTRVLVMVQRSPMWASGSLIPEAPPLDPQDYADFMRELVARYQGKVEAYELWNEPNHPRFWPSGPDAAEYVELLKAGHGAVKSVDPDAEVVFGGLAGNAIGYLQNAYLAEPELGRYFDAMALHPYPKGAMSPSEVLYQPDGQIDTTSFVGYRRVRDLMLEHGDTDPIWLTEVGWATTTEPHYLGGVTEEQQADYVTEAFEVMEQDPYVEVAFWYNLRNNYWALDADTWEDQLGLLRTDFSPKPAYEAFKALPSTLPEDPAEPDSDPNRSASALSLRLVPLRTGATRRAGLAAEGEAAYSSQRAVKPRLSHRGANGRWRHRALPEVVPDESGHYAFQLRLARGHRWRLAVAQRDDSGVLHRRAIRFGT